MKVCSILAVVQFCTVSDFLLSHWRQLLHRLNPSSVAILVVNVILILVGAVVIIIVFVVILINTMVFIK
jgi:hypothetical protein